MRCVRSLTASTRGRPVENEGAAYFVNSGSVETLGESSTNWRTERRVGSVVVLRMWCTVSQGISLVNWVCDAI